MKNNESKYREDILEYLETKYNEEFVIKRLSRIKTIGSVDTVYALCASKRFPDDLFEVALTLSIYDIYGKDEVTEFLRRADVYGDETVEDEGQLLADNYINIIVQNAFDEKLEEIDATFVKTQITTPNKYLNVSDKNITPDTFFECYGNDVVVYTSIFVENENKLEDSRFLNENARLIVCDKLQDQFLFYYATDLGREEIESLYIQNYHNNNEYFYDAATTHQYMLEKYSMGEKE